MESDNQTVIFGNRIPFNPQYFIQGDYLEDDGSDKSEYYKVYFTMEGVGAASRIDKQEDGTFKHVWTRAKTRESKSSSWHEKTKLDIVCIGRYSYIFQFDHSACTCTIILIIRYLRSTVTSFGENFINFYVY